MKTLLTLILLAVGFHTHAQHVDEMPSGHNTNFYSKLNGLGCDIVSSFSTAPNATIGLDNEGPFLWTTYTGSTPYIFKLDTMGNKLDSIDVATLSIGVGFQDIEVSGNKLWTVPEGPAKMYEVNLNSGGVTEINLPAFGIEPYHYFSAAFDGQYLWVLNYQTPTFETRLYKMDTSTFAILDSVDLAHPVITIEMIGNEMWGYCVAQCFPFQMFRINTSTGAFTDSSEWCITGSAYGMAWDGTYLWQTAGFNQLIDKIDIGFVGILPVLGAPTPVLSVFPNPAGSTIEISSKGLKGTLIIRNSCGLELNRFAVSEKNVSCSVDNYPSGIYTAHLYHDDGSLLGSAMFAVQ